ncbi:hypothetical protein ACLOJK_008548 [Asimina triloba]
MHSFMNISNNQFKESLMPKLLEVFDCFPGLLPTSVAKLPKLKHLNLGWNYFMGWIPSSYGSLKQLQFLHLSGNDLGGFIPAELGNLTNLQSSSTFNSVGWNLEGHLPPELGPSRAQPLATWGKRTHGRHSCRARNETKHNKVPSKLVRLDLSITRLFGNLPSSIGDFSNLEVLLLAGNQFFGEIPSKYAS